MRPSTIIFAILALVSHAPAQNKSLAERLGYPADSKLLIIHADDLAVAHSEDAASFDALDKRAASSASIMIPCPWLTEVADYAMAHPDADLGLHLTLTSEWQVYRWGPVSPRDQVPSLFGPSGYLWPETGPAVEHIKADEAEREIRAQVERAEAMGIHPTHLDSHMAVLFARPDLFAAYVKVAHEYRLPFLAMRDANAPPALRAVLSDKDIVPDAIVMANPKIAASEWTNFYATAIQNLKPGFTEIIVHLGHDDAELRAVTLNHPDYGAAWRQRDYDVITSPEFKRQLDQHHVILIHWSEIKKLIE
jgi:chitin disaccharide deacetylase